MLYWHYKIEIFRAIDIAIGKTNFHLEFNFIRSVYFYFLYFTLRAILFVNYNVISHSNNNNNNNFPRYYFVNFLFLLQDNETIFQNIHVSLILIHFKKYIVLRKYDWDKKYLQK